MASFIIRLASEREVPNVTTFSGKPRTSAPYVPLFLSYHTCTWYDPCRVWIVTCFFCAVITESILSHAARICKQCFGTFLSLVRQPTDILLSYVRHPDAPTRNRT